MKIGFVIGDWKGKIEDDGTVKEGEEENLGRVLLSKDGMSIVFKNPWGDDIKVEMKAFVGCAVVVDGGEEGGGGTLSTRWGSNWNGRRPRRVDGGVR